MAFPANSPQVPQAIPKARLIEFFQDHGVQTHRLVEAVWTPTSLELTYLVADTDNRAVYNPKTGDFVYTTRHVDLS